MINTMYRPQILVTKRHTHNIRRPRQPSYTCRRGMWRGDDDRPEQPGYPNEGAVVQHRQSSTNQSRREPPLRAG